MQWPDGLFSLAKLEEAWERVRENGGAPGVDNIAVGAFESDSGAGLRALLADLESGRYRPQPYRAVQVPKPDGGRRRLVIATLRDRVAMTAATMWLQPHIEPLFHPCSFAYRPGKGVQDALSKVAEFRDRGLACALRADVEAFFDSVDHEVMAALLGTAGVEDSVTGLIRTWLTCAVADSDGCEPATLGLPQGLPVAPLLANLYLTPFDRAMAEHGWKLVRYADDFVVCCATPEDALRAKGDAINALASLKLGLKAGKTQTATFAAGFTFLGAGFVGDDILPATPHPYEEAFAPPPPPHEPIVPSGVPHLRLRTLYVQQQGAHIGCHGGRVVVSRNYQTLLDLPMHQIDQIFLFGQVHLSAAAMSACLWRRIPVHLFSGRGSYHGALLAVDGAEFNVERAQYSLLDNAPRRLAAAGAIVRGKLANSLALLRRHGANHSETALDDILARLDDAVRRTPDASEPDALRGIEGAAASAFFEGFARCLRGSLSFSHRNRHPPLDPVNSLLSFGYTLMLYQIHSALAAREIDPAVGIFHESGRGHPALASDLLEEFRAPVVDSLVLALANRQQFSPDDFYRAAGEPQPCLLKDEPRARFLQAFEEKLAECVRHPEASDPVDWRRVIELQVGRMRRFILGETSDYAAFVWE